MDTNISILLPTRGRTDQLDKSVTSLLYLAAEPEKLQWVFGFDKDDAESFDWFKNSKSDAFYFKPVEALVQHVSPKQAIC